jgi:hypothetical protein
VALFDGLHEIINQELGWIGGRSALSKRDAVVLGSEFLELLPDSKRVVDSVWERELLRLVFHKDTNILLF